MVDTDEGIQGFGEAFYFGGPAQVVAALIDGGLGPLIIGRDPMDTVVPWEELYNLYTQVMKIVAMASAASIPVTPRV